MCKVICDTNIWYDLASGKITAEQIKDFKLIATNVNVTEISTTPNLKNNLDLVKGAILEIKNKHYQIFPLNPIEHIAAIFNIAFPFQKADFQRLLDNLATFVELDFENDITQEDTLKAIEQIKKIENDKIVYASFINQNLYTKKMEIRKNHEKKLM